MSPLYSQMYHESRCFSSETTNYGIESNTYESATSVNHQKDKKHLSSFLVSHLPFTNTYLSQFNNNLTTKPSSKFTNTSKEYPAYSTSTTASLVVPPLLLPLKSPPRSQQTDPPRTPLIIPSRSQQTNTTRKTIWKPRTTLPPRPPILTTI